MKIIQPFLSVIIPAHNEEKTICKTVNSLLLQDYPYFEIIVVDDGSEDNTCKNLIDRFGMCLIDKVNNQCALKHKTIVQIWNQRCNDICLYLVQKENGGKGDALNAGICFCRGDYFVCIDADCMLQDDTMSCLSKVLRKNKDTVAVGGRVLPLTGLQVFLDQKGFHLREALQSFQEMEYSIAFCIIRPIFDKLGTSMLISGALGLFNKDVVIQLGGYALDTVGEDMELVMRIRRFATESDELLKIRYTKEAVCFTELPWNESDLRKQRIRWTVGLTDVLWKYREMAFKRKYSFLEKATFWYYVIHEKFSPHIDFISFVMCIILGLSHEALVLSLASVSCQFLLVTISSFQSVKRAVKLSENKIRSNLKFLLLTTAFVSVYQLWHSVCRLIAVPHFRRAKRKTGNQGPSWVSPTRM